MVWGPEMVDKAILHTERVVDRKKPYLYFYSALHIYNQQP